jgi:hypothetical protein
MNENIHGVLFGVVFILSTMKKVGGALDQGQLAESYEVIKDVTIFSFKDE